MSELHAIFGLDFPAYLHGPALVGALMGFGLVVGVLTGLFGVGGGFLITPLLNVGFGIPYELAIGSSLSFTIGTASSGMSRHMRLRNFEPRSTVILAATSILGAVAGASGNQSLRAHLGPYRYTLTMDALFVALLGLTAWLVWRGSDRHRSGRSPLQRFPLPPRVSLPAANLNDVSLPGLCLVGLCIGLTAGMMGVGGGVLFMPLLILVVGLTPHQAVGTSLGTVVFSATAGTISYGLNGNVNLWIVMALLVASVIGVQIGAWLCHRLRADRLRRCLALVTGLTALAVLVRLACSILSGPGGGK